MTKLSNTKLVLILFLLFSVLFLAVSLKLDIDRLHKEYNLLTKQVYQIEYNWNHHMHEIRNSIIFLHYNNDEINKQIRKNINYLENIQKNSRYPKTSYLISKHLEEYKKVELLTYKFMMSNARIKNSFYILESKLKNLKEYDTTYGQNLVSIVSNLSLYKKSFNNEKKVSISLIDYFKNYPLNNERKFNLNLLHLNMLYKEIPILHELYKSLDDGNINSLYSQMLKTLQKESAYLKKDVKSKFFIILIAYVLSILIIIYFIEKSRRDTVEIIKLQKEKENSLLYDKLTGMKNRNAFILNVKDEKYVVILFDIIGFSKINSFIGYAGADKILKEFALFLKNNYLDVYRVSGDHFAVVHEKNSLENVVNELKELLVSFDKQKFFYNGIEVPIHINVGISNKMYYLKNAEIAISKNKDKFKRICIYDESMSEEEELTNNFKMLTKIKKAIENDNIKPYFQPIVDLKTKQFIKYEALVRLIDEDKVIVPYFFLDLAKKSKLYPDITKIVIKKSVDFIKKHNKEVSINLSYLDISDVSTMTCLKELLSQNKDIASLITFEILESEEIDNYEMVFDFSKEIRVFGCKLAIDDFGSGYSNFTQLFNIKPDIVKIDGSLIKDIHINKDSKNIVETIVSLASKANIKTVAEFVDSKEVDEVICDLNIDYGQGFYYSRPKDLI